LECSALFLAQIAGSDPQATHVVIWDGAGFHPSDGESGLPANVRPLKLPACSPELNPVEKLCDVVKDGICNRLFATVCDLQEALSGVLAEWRSDARRVSDLVGAKGWLVAHANFTSPKVLPAP
jgi:hypothetical protein